MYLSGVWSCRLTNLNKLFQLFSGMAVNTTRGLFSPSVIGNIFCPYLGERIIHFSKWNFCNACSFQCLLGSFAGSTQASIQLRAEKLSSFSPLQDFRRHRKWAARNAVWRKYLTLLKKWKFKIIVFNFARNLNVEFELRLLAVMYSVVAWSTSHSASDGIFEHISLWLWLFKLL